jgi:hypothetical protein
MSHGGGVNPVFPPLDHALVKGVACDLVAETQQPLKGQSLADITARARKALGKSISRSTGWRMLDTDAIKPWRYQYWIVPRDPHLAAKAGPILDLYAGTCQGQPLGSKAHILSADEKTSIQARRRCHSALSPASGRAARIEHEYERGGALQYLAAWDLRRGYVIGRCEPATGLEPFGRLVHQVLAQEPYRSGDACSGSWTTARRIVAKPPRHGCSRSIPASFWSMLQSTPVGSTKLRSTSRSSNGRC